MNRTRTWEVDEAESAPAADVARRTLRRRLDAVWRELAAACRSGDDAERVHQLRVASRRALAAIDAFRDLLPAKQRAWFCKRLRRVRRAAGDARDLDVLTARLAEERQAGRQASAATRARARLVAMLSNRRVVSRQPIHEQYERLSVVDWRAHVERLTEGIPARRGASTFGVYARRRFKARLRRFFARADHRLREDAEIHRLRIEGKKLRYTFEIFARVFPERVRAKCQKALETLQEGLGEFTDHAAAADRLRRWAREPAA